MKKKCTKCHEIKDIEEFISVKANSTGKGSWCKKCDYKRTSDWKKSKEYTIVWNKNHRYYMLYKYGKYLDAFESKDSAQRAIARHKRKLAEDRLEMLRIDRMESEL